MTKALETLVRLRQMELDALRREVGALNREVEAIDEKKDRLGRQIVEEQVYLSRLEGITTYASYAQSVQSWQDDLDAQRTSVESKITFKMNQVRTAFDALKTAEGVRDQAKAKVVAARAKKDAQAADEAALNLYRRSQKTQ